MVGWRSLVVPLAYLTGTSCGGLESVVMWTRYAVFGGDILWRDALYLAGNILWRPALRGEGSICWQVISAVGRGSSVGSDLAVVWTRCAKVESFKARLSAVK